METVKFDNLKFKKIIKIIIISLLSFFLFLSFRSSILFSNYTAVFLIIYLIFQLLIILGIYFKNIIVSNILILIIINLFITPIFFNITFDIPYRHPNTINLLKWDINKDAGFLKQKHKITTDQKGNRVNKEINYLEKSQDTLRVFTIGASTTEEEGMDDSLTWSNNLIKLLESSSFNNKKNYEVINLGIGGLRTIHHYFTLKRNINLKPDLIIFLIGVNDWNFHIINSEESFLFSRFEVPFDFRSSLLYKFFNKGYKQISKKIDNVFGKNTNVQNIEPKDNNKIDNPYNDLINIQSSLKRNIDNYTEINIHKVSERYVYWLNKTSNFCVKNDLDCIFMDQPTVYDLLDKNKNIQNRIWMDPPFQNYKIKSNNMLKIANLYNSYLQENSKSKNIKFCKLSEKINSDSNNFIDDVHFSPNGSKNVANFLHKCIKKLY